MYSSLPSASQRRREEISQDYRGGRDGEIEYEQYSSGRFSSACRKSSSTAGTVSFLNRLKKRFGTSVLTPRHTEHTRALYEDNTICSVRDTRTTLSLSHIFMSDKKTACQCTPLHTVWRVRNQYHSIQHCIQAHKFSTHETTRLHQSRL